MYILITSDSRLTICRCSPLTAIICKLIISDTPTTIPSLSLHNWKFLRRYGNEYKTNTIFDRSYSKLRNKVTFLRALIMNNLKWVVFSRILKSPQKRSRVSRSFRRWSNISKSSRSSSGSRLSSSLRWQAPSLKAIMFLLRNPCLHLKMSFNLMITLLVICKEIILSPLRTCT